MPVVDTLAAALRGLGSTISAAADTMESRFSSPSRQAAARAAEASLVRKQEDQALKIAVSDQIGRILDYAHPRAGLRIWDRTEIGVPGDVFERLNNRISMAGGTVEIFFPVPPTSNTATGEPVFQAPEMAVLQIGGVRVGRRARFSCPGDPLVDVNSAAMSLLADCLPVLRDFGDKIEAMGLVSVSKSRDQLFQRASSRLEEAKMQSDEAPAP